MRLLESNLVRARSPRVLLDQQIPHGGRVRRPAARSPTAPGGLDARADRRTTTRRSSSRCVSERPAVHRFPGSMGKRLQDHGAGDRVDDYDGNAAALWSAGDPDGSRGAASAQGPAGFGDQKAEDLRGPARQAVRRDADRWSEAPRATTARQGTHMSGRRRGRCRFVVDRCGRTRRPPRRQRREGLPARPGSSLLPAEHCCQDRDRGRYFAISHAASARREAEGPERPRRRSRSSMAMSRDRADG